MLFASRYLFKEQFYPFGREHFPEGGHRPAGGKDVVVVAFAVFAVVPVGMLHHFGIVARFGYATEMAFIGQQLAHGGTDDLGESRETFFAILRRQPVEHGGEVEDIHVDVVVFHRHVAPAAGLQTHVAEHLALGKGHVPGVVPRQAEVSRLPCQVGIAAAFVALGGQCQVVEGGGGLVRGFLVLAVGIERGGEVIGLGNDFALQVVRRAFGRFEVFLVFKIFRGEHEHGRGRRGAAPAAIDHGEVVAELAGEMAVGLLEGQDAVEHGAHAGFPLRMLAPLRFFVLQVIKHGVQPLGLAADAEIAFLIVLRVIHHFAEEARRGEAVVQVAVERGAGLVHQVLPTLLLAILQGVERVEQHAAHEADFGRALVGAVVGAAESKNGAAAARAVADGDRREIILVELLFEP